MRRGANSTLYCCSAAIDIPWLQHPRRAEHHATAPALRCWLAVPHPDCVGARLPIAFQSLDRLAVPLRADVLGLRAHGARIAWRGRRDLSHGTPRVALPSLVRRRTRSGPGRAATTVRLVCVAVLDAGAAANFIEDCAMNDIRRTLLWVVFSMSLVLLWDGWNKHNGEPSLISPKPAPRRSSPTSSIASPSASACPSRSSARSRKCRC